METYEMRHGTGAGSATYAKDKQNDHRSAKVASDKPVDAFVDFLRDPSLRIQQASKKIPTTRAPAVPPPKKSVASYPKQSGGAKPTSPVGAVISSSSARAARPSIDSPLTSEKDALGSDVRASGSGKSRRATAIKKGAYVEDSMSNVNFKRGNASKKRLGPRAANQSQDSAEASSKEPKQKALKGKKIARKGLILPSKEPLFDMAPEMGRDEADRVYKERKEMVERDALEMAREQEEEEEEKKLSIVPRKAKDLIVCPWCEESVPEIKSKRLLAMLQGWLDQWHAKASIRSTDTLEVCQLHRDEGRVIPEGLAKGYPSVLDAKALTGRVLGEAVMAPIEGYLMDPEPSHYFQKAKKEGRQAANSIKAFTDPDVEQAGYYGEQGVEVIRTALLARLCHEGSTFDLREPTVLERFKPLSSVFQVIQRVLTPEIVCLLIATDLDVDIATARDIKRDSNAYGMAAFPVEAYDEEVDGPSSSSNIKSRGSKTRSAARAASGKRASDAITVESSQEKIVSSLSSSDNSQNSKKRRRNGDSSKDSAQAAPPTIAKPRPRPRPFTKTVSQSRVHPESSPEASQKEDFTGKQSQSTPERPAPTVHVGKTRRRRAKISAYSDDEDGEMTGAAAEALSSSLSGLVPEQESLVSTQQSAPFPSSSPHMFTLAQDQAFSAPSTPFSSGCAPDNVLNSSGSSGQNWDTNMRGMGFAIPHGTQEGSDCYDG